VLVDRNESALVELVHELKERRVRRVFAKEVDGNNEHALRQLMQRHRFDLVLDAAVSHLHVSQMAVEWALNAVVPGHGQPSDGEDDDTTCESARNNALRVYRSAVAAAEHGVERYVLASSLMAAAPPDAHVATQTLAERLVLGLSDTPLATRFVAVRLGDAFRAPGSLVPRFERDTRSGGPVIVPDVTERRFMTTARAAELLLHAARDATSGQLLTTRGGLRTDLLELAEEVVRLQGREPHREVKIKLQPSGGRRAPWIVPPPERELASCIHPELFCLETPVDPERTADVGRRLQALVAANDASGVGALLREQLGDGATADHGWTSRHDPCLPSVPS
jgi:FlaA1/EpsC-like NDP-sugar epimerase